MATKLFTHTDFDGIGCAIIAKLIYKDVDITYCDYNNVDKIIEDFINTNEYLKYDFIYITDISIKENIAKLIIEKEVPVRLLDHHATATYLNKNIWCKVKTEINNELTCGTELFYLDNGGYAIDAPFKTNMIQFIEIVRKYDTWLWKTKYNDNLPKKWNDLLYIMGRDDFIDYMINKIKIDKYLDFDDFSLNLLKIEERRIKEYIDYKNKTIILKEILNLKCGIVFGENYISELGNTLSEINPELDVIIIVNMDGKISYRTIKENIDLGKDFAKLYGGGGHKKAAGSEFKDLLKNEFIDKLFL